MAECGYYGPTSYSGFFVLVSSTTHSKPSIRPPKAFATGSGKPSVPYLCLPGKSSVRSRGRRSGPSVGALTAGPSVEQNARRYHVVVMVFGGVFIVN